VTAGKIFAEILERERAGDFLGETIQMIPQVTDAIKSKILALAQQETLDFLLVEIGGTVGDYENQLFFEAARQLRQELGAENVLFVLLTLLPWLGASEEFKTKPTQQAVKLLRELGISPDFLVLRAEQEIPGEIKKKVAFMTGVSEKSVILSPNRASIYEVPLDYAQQDFGVEVLRAAGLREEQKFALAERQKFVGKIRAPRRKLCVAMVGKYTRVRDSYFSLFAALEISAAWLGVELEIELLDAENLDVDVLKTFSAVLVPGGFGARGIAGKIEAIRVAREEKIPFLGICLGCQLMAIEFARTMLGIPDATSQEFVETGENLVVVLSPEQQGVLGKGATMRLGNYDCALEPGSRAEKIWGESEISERHRHRFEISEDFVGRSAAAGLRVSGRNPARGLVEILELENHPFAVGVQFHPELTARPLLSHPLFDEFLRAGLACGGNS